MNLHALTLGPLATNCYLLWEDQKAGALLIDCAGQPHQIARAAQQRGLTIRLIVITHGHGDHIEGLAELKQVAGAELAIHELDAPMLSDPGWSGAALWGSAQRTVSADRLLREADAIALPETARRLAVLHTPGHTPGSICLLGDGVLFSGDCLFAGGIGRVDLPGGDERTMLKSLGRLARLDPGLAVYPGHGPPTTIGQELAENPWLQEL